MSAFTSLELFVTDSIVHIVESFNRTRPPRLLLMVSGWVPNEPQTRDLLKNQPGTGVCGVSLGIPIAEAGTADERRTFKWYAPEMAVSGVSTPLSWRSIGSEDIGRIVAALAALGIPNSEPKLDGLLNASGDYAHCTNVTGTIDGRPFRIRLNDMCSGYRGPDAPAFAALMRILLALAGLDATAERWRALFKAEAPRG